ncbi:MAG: hypothetical protein LBL72_06610 [Candidatus Accumulibacter sp.]|jgi:hypothetical protein|nr:hypothetical protein [Accumulibacter sp.]
MNNDNENWPSLAQHFDAPDGYTGHFGWLCGYSADATFLDDAVERFTGLTQTLRANQGRIALAVLLDRGPQISLIDAPGVAHFPIKYRKDKLFRLLHAKVALLGFRRMNDDIQTENNSWRLRLIVSTGNWTRQTLEKSLDLAWCVDISSEELSSKTLDENTRSVCADIEAANDFLQWTAKLFDTRLLDATVNGKFSETKNAKDTFHEWVAACTKKPKGHARFFDNRKKSLLSQLPAKIKGCGRDYKRNYLAMGSGFYESSKDGEPKVPLKVIEALKKEALLTQNPDVNIYVNSNACQAIAGSVEFLRKQMIKVRPANQSQSVFGKNDQRSLHAKFLFSARAYRNSCLCNGAWVYLGSGNLTAPGFVNKMSESEGNLEAGVVFAPEGLLWEGGKNDLKKVVTNLLPIQYDKEIDDETSLEQGPDMELRDEDIYVAPPITWLIWNDRDKELQALDAGAGKNPNEILNDFALLDSKNHECQKTKTGFQWLEQQPRLAKCRWSVDGVQFESMLPVIDQFGRIAAAELKPINFITDALLQLEYFPQPSNDDDVDEYGNIGNGQSKDTALRTGSYPIQRMMELIESIADRQTRIAKQDWPLWCNRLEQTMSLAKDSGETKMFIEMKLNPLSPLWCTPFRPDFAETCASKEGAMYEAALKRIEEAWQCNRLRKIGDKQ